MTTLPTTHSDGTGEVIAASIINDIATQVNANTTAIAAGSPPSGPAGGALANTFPNPTLAAGVATGAVLGADVVKTSTSLVGDVTGTTGATVIPALSITTAKIAANAVTAAKLAAGAATGAALGSDVATKVGGLVPISQLASGTPTGSKFISDAGTLLVPPATSTSNIERTWESFGGTLTGNLAAQTTVWTAARAWLVSNGGGTILFGVGSYQHMPSLDLPPYTTIAGCGFVTTELVADSTLAAHFVQNHKSTSGTTSDPNGIACTIQDIALNCFFMGGWGTSAFDAIHFDRNPTFGTDPTIGSGSIVEPNHTVKNVIIRNPPRDGINATAMGGHLYQNVRTIGCGRYGFRPTFDSWMLTCSAASSLSHGFHLDNGPTRLVECVAYNSGNSAAHAAQGQGFFVDGSSGIADSVTLVQCEAQDNFGDGFKISGVPFATVGLIGCLADSNSAGSVGTYPGFNIINAPYTRMTACRAVERKSDGTNSWQRNALSISGSSFCTIDLTHKAQDSGNGAATLGTPILSADTASLGCDVNINGLKGVQQPAFAASFTPDFYTGGIVQTGVLTANITINAPTNGPWIVGTRATFILKQDSTGGRTITWNGTYVNTPQPVTTANAYTIGRFIYDGTSWVGI